MSKSNNLIEYGACPNSNSKVLWLNVSRKVGTDFTYDDILCWHNCVFKLSYCNLSQLNAPNSSRAKVRMVRHYILENSDLLNGHSF